MCSLMYVRFEDVLLELYRTVAASIFMRFEVVLIF